MASWEGRRNVSFFFKHSSGLLILLTREAYWWKGAQDFHAVLSGERMRRVHAAEVGETGGRVGRGPAQDVAQLGRVRIDGVPRHQELGGKEGRFSQAWR